MAKPCGATCDLTDGTTLTCDLAGDHFGPLHSDDGNAWGDIDLPMPTDPEFDD